MADRQWNDMNNDGNVDWKDYVIMNDIAEMNKEKNEDDNSASTSFSHTPSSSSSNTGSGIVVPNIGICLVLGILLEAILSVAFDWEIYDMSRFVVILLWFVCSFIVGVMIMALSGIFQIKR